LIFEDIVTSNVSEQIATSRIDGISNNDAKSFVHHWCVAADARDAGSMIARTSEG